MNGRRHAISLAPRAVSRLAPVILLAFLLTLAGSLTALAASGSSQGRTPPKPLDVRASAGATGTIAVVSWDPGGAGVSGYRVWRSSRGIEGFDAVGSTAATAFTDAGGAPGRTYFYRVTALKADGTESDASTMTAGVTPMWNESPHTTYGKGNLCLVCHATAFRGAKGAAAETAVCYSCHDGSGARSNVKDGPVDSFALASGHSLVPAKGAPGLTTSCSSCHSPHADVRKRPGLYRRSINGHKASDANAWCAGCHDDRSSWSKGYPSTALPSRDASGYPVLGTYPGPSVYDDRAKHAHAKARGTSGPRGDCLLCHAAHRGPNKYDGLLMTFYAPSAATVASDQADGTYASLCLACHAGQKMWAKQGAADIARYVTQRDGSGTYLGHSILTSGGTLPAGAPLPCYDCHNPHGSSRGNSSMISDALGKGLSTSSGTGVRAFCFSCHSSSDGMVWDSVSAAYSPAGASTFEGLPRDGAGGNQLKLDSSVAAHASSAVDSCYDCHGSDYAGAAGNVHAPLRGYASPQARVAPQLRSDERTATQSTSARRSR
jgi:hypothetical protein